MEFYKYSATGNDFMLFDNRFNLIPTENKKLWQGFCQRRTGVGADGVIFLEYAENATFKMHYLNADGGEVSMCGNGTRAITHFAHHILKIPLPIEGYKIQTRAGVYTSNFEDQMPMVHMSSYSKLPEVLIDGESYAFYNTGVPHLVIPVSDIHNYPVVMNGKKLRHNPQFKEGTNVNFFEKVGENYWVRTFERGVEDETLSCGTGVTAVAWHLKNQNPHQNEFAIECLGGKLTVRFIEKKAYLKGAVDLVFKGQIAV